MTKALLPTGNWLGPRPSSSTCCWIAIGAHSSFMSRELPWGLIWLCMWQTFMCPHLPLNACWDRPQPHMTLNRKINTLKANLQHFQKVRMDVLLTQDIFVLDCYVDMEVHRLPNWSQMRCTDSSGWRDLQLEWMIVIKHIRSHCLCPLPASWYITDVWKLSEYSHWKSDCIKYTNIKST